MNNPIILPDGAGWVGQNLVTRLKAKGYADIVVLDKHRANMTVLRQVQPEITVEYADLAESDDWQRHIVGADVAVMLQAQTGGNDYVSRFWSLIMMIIRNVLQFIFKLLHRLG